MSKAVIAKEKLQQNKVWQPSGHGGIEVGIKASDRELQFPKHLIQNYTIVVNGVGKGDT